MICVDGNPYEVRVRRVTEDDCDLDTDGIIPPEPITQRIDER